MNDTDNNVLDENGDEKKIFNEISILNTYMKNANKDSVNSQLAETCYISAVAPVFVHMNTDKETKDTIPFEIHVLDPKNAFVVYSNGFRGERLFSVRLFVKTNYKKNERTLYMEVHTKDKKFTYKMPYKEYLDYNGKEIFAENIISYVKVEKPLEEVNLLGIPIFEYTLNKDRLSLVEMGLDVQNVLNQITSADIDDIEQFVQSLTVITDADIDKEVWKEAIEAGIIKITTTKDKKGRIEVITNKMQHSETKVFYDRLLNQLLINLGIPTTGGGSYDTGTAGQINEGWEMADSKGRYDERGYMESDKHVLQYVLKLLKRNKHIEDLSIGDIETKFNRNKIDNIQSKAQTFQTLVSGGLHPELALQVSNLVNDPAAAYQKSFEFFGKDFYTKQQKNSNDTQTVQKQNTEDDTEEEPELE